MLQRLHYGQVGVCELSVLAYHGDVDLLREVVPLVCQAALPEGEVNGWSAAQPKDVADGLVRGLGLHDERYMPDVADIMKREDLLGRYMAEECLQGKQYNGTVRLIPCRYVVATLAGVGGTS